MIFFSCKTVNFNTNFPKNKQKISNFITENPYRVKNCKKELYIKTIINFLTEQKEYLAVEDYKNIN